MSYGTESRLQLVPLSNAVVSGAVVAANIVTFQLHQPYTALVVGVTYKVGGSVAAGSFTFSSGVIGGAVTVFSTVTAPTAIIAAGTTVFKHVDKTLLASGLITVSVTVAHAGATDIVPFVLVVPRSEEFHQFANHVKSA